MIARAALVALLAAGLASAQGGERICEQGCDRLVEALALVAARDGAESARQLTGPELPGYLDRALGALQDAPEAQDLRGFTRLRLQVTLVPRLLAPEAIAAARARFTRDASGRLEGALSMLERDCARLRAAALALRERTSREGVVSRLAARAHDAGEELLVLAGGAPLWRARLDAATTPAARYAVLADLLDHTPDPLVDFTVSLFWRAPDLVAAELGALDRDGAVGAAREQLAARLRRTAEVLSETVDASVEAVTAIRDVELARVLAGGRSPELQQAVRLHAAYKAQFGAPPDLEATPWLDVYAQRGSGQLFFWAEQEGRWIAGGDPVAPLEPVLEALVASRSPALRAQLGNARALGTFYTLFHDAAAVPFREGLEAFLTPIRDTAGRWQAAAEVLHGVGRLDRTPEGLALVLGYTAFVGQTGEADAVDALLRTRLSSGAERARALQAATARTASRWARQRLVPVRLRVELPATLRADLSWTPAVDDPRWLIPPGETVGAEELRGILRLNADAPSPQVVVEAGAREGDHYLTGAHTWTPDGDTPAQLRLESGPGPLLAPCDQGRRVVQLPREGRLLHLRLKTPRGVRLLRPHPHGAWLDADPRDPAEDGVILALDAQGRARAASRRVSLPARAGVVVSGAPGAGTAWHVEPGQPVEARVLRRGVVEDGPFRFVVRDAGGARVHEARGAALTWQASAPAGRYQVSVDGAEPAWFAISRTPPRVVACATPWTAPLRRVSPGQGCVLRVEAWPWLSAEEVTHVAWRWGGADGREALTYPLPEQPGTALQLPLVIDAGAASGPRTLVAQIHTLRGTLTVEGALEVAPGRAIGLSLRDETGRALEALVRGGLALVRPAEQLRDTRWTLVDPAGRCRELEARPDGLGAVSVAPDGLWGRFEVWLTGETLAGGERVHARLPISVTRGRPGAEQGVPFAWIHARAQGTDARANALRPVQAEAQGSSLAMATAPGPLGTLSLRTEIPPKVGDGPARVRLLLVGEPREPPAGAQLPGVWATLGRRAQLCVEASLQLERDGRLIQIGTVRRVEAGGVDLTLEVTLDDAGIRVHALHAPQAALEAELGPGLRRARHLDLVVRARLRPALPPSVWPPARDPPTPLEVDGVRWALDPDLLPQTSVELRARWSRSDPVAETPIGALDAGAPRRLVASEEVAAAEAALAEDRPAAAAIHARRAALLGDDPRAWTALAEVALSRRRPREALALARLALDAAERPRAWIVAGEAALSCGQLGEARDAAAAAAAALPPGSALASRLQRLERKLR